MNNPTKPDADGDKGAVEHDRPSKNEQVSLDGQIVHRGIDRPDNGEDSDFPEPGSSPEHSGELGEVEKK
jgi:hypothetical protein